MASCQTWVNGGIKNLRTDTKNAAMSPKLRFQVVQEGKQDVLVAGRACNAPQLWAGASVIRLIRGYPGGLGLPAGEGRVLCMCSVLPLQMQDPGMGGD